MVLKIALLAMLVMLVTPAFAQKFGDCMANSVLSVNDITTTPYPPSVSSGFSADYDLQLNEELDGDITVKLDVRKKAFGIWAKIPCVEDVGSCTYEDICTLMEDNIDSGICDVLTAFKLPCSCPLLPVSYKGTQVVPPMDIGAIGSFVAGEYKARAEIKQGRRTIGCIEAEAVIKK